MQVLNQDRDGGIVGILGQGAVVMPFGAGIIAHVVKLDGAGIVRVAGIAVAIRQGKGRDADDQDKAECKEQKSLYHELSSFARLQ